MTKEKKRTLTELFELNSNILSHLEVNYLNQIDNLGVTYNANYWHTTIDDLEIILNFKQKYNIDFIVFDINYRSIVIELHNVCKEDTHQYINTKTDILPQLKKIFRQAVRENKIEEFLKLF